MNAAQAIKPMSGSKWVLFCTSSFATQIELAFHGLVILRYDCYDFMFENFRTEYYIRALDATVCLGPTKNLALCWTLRGGMMSPVVKHGPASYALPGCMYGAGAS